MGDTGHMSMAAGSLIGGGASVGNALAQSGAYRSQGEYGKAVGDLNARTAALQAQDALQRGEQESALVGRRAAATIGGQRASYAAQGVDVNAGSAAGAQADTAGLSALDQLTIKNNATRAAWGFRMQGIQDTLQGKLSALAGKTNATSSLITGGLAFMKSGMYAGYYASQNQSAPKLNNPNPSDPDYPKEDPNNP
jgi:hypothetical protein